MEPEYGDDGLTDEEREAEGERYASTTREHVERYLASLTSWPWKRY